MPGSMPKSAPTISGSIKGKVIQNEMQNSNKVTKPEIPQEYHTMFIYSKGTMSSVHIWKLKNEGKDHDKTSPRKC